MFDRARGRRIDGDRVLMIARGDLAFSQAEFMLCSHLDFRIDRRVRVADVFVWRQTPPTDNLFLAILPEAHARPRMPAPRSNFKPAGLNGKLLAADDATSLFTFANATVCARLVGVMKAAAAISVAVRCRVRSRDELYGDSVARLCGGDGVAKLVALNLLRRDAGRLGRGQPFVPHLTLRQDDS